MNRLGRHRKFEAALHSLASDGGEMHSPEAVPTGQKLKLTLDEAPGEAFDLISAACQTEGASAYRVKLRLATGTWPYQLYSKLASRAHAPSVTAGSAPMCLRDLELKSGCNIEDVEAAFARLVRKHHPDRGGTVDEFVRIRRAYLEAMALLGARR